MAKQAEALDVNTNPLAFEELATSLASLASYMDSGNFDQVVADFEGLYRRAVHQPPNYLEITEIAGQSLAAGDRRSGRGAWLLMNIKELEVYAVHSLLWHQVGRKFYAPVLDQVSKAIEMPSQLADEDLQILGKDDTSVLDVLGVKDRAVWVVQTLWEKRNVDSAVVPNSRSKRPLFRRVVFENPVLQGTSLSTLFYARGVLRKAFPTADVYTFALVLHPKVPDFELYQVDLGRTRPDKVVLQENLIETNSLAYEDRLRKDHESLWTLPKRLDNVLFRGIPPCRGGRTLSILAAAAHRQLKAERLLTWNERDVMKMLKEDFKYHVPRDKVRHDLLDRLVGQGFMRKWASEYFLTVKGMARYQYCLAKYTDQGSEDPMKVLDICKAHRDKVFERFHCV